MADSIAEAMPPEEDSLTQYAFRRRCFSNAVANHPSSFSDLAIFVSLP
jgi:hypothetical protein